jgi:hypothetical protein
MDPIDEDFLVGLNITGARSPQSESERDRMARLGREGYLVVFPGPPMKYGLASQGHAAVGAKKRRAPKGE